MVQNIVTSLMNSPFMIRQLIKCVTIDKEITVNNFIKEVEQNKYIKVSKAINWLIEIDVFSQITTFPGGVGEGIENKTKSVSIAIAIAYWN